MKEYIAIPCEHFLHTVASDILLNDCRSNDTAPNIMNYHKAAAILAATSTRNVLQYCGLCWLFRRTDNPGMPAYSSLPKKRVFLNFAALRHTMPLSFLYLCFVLSSATQCSETTIYFWLGPLSHCRRHLTHNAFVSKIHATKTNLECNTASSIKYHRNNGKPTDARRNARGAGEKSYPGQAHCRSKQK